MQRLVEVIRRAQVDRVVAGEYGVQAQAKAAAPAVMEHVTELAGEAGAGGAGEAGRRCAPGGGADVDDLGDKVERKAHLHLHVLEEMSEAELEALAAGGVWPERYRGWRC